MKLIVKKLYVNGYKNLKNIDIRFNPNINIFCGENAQGKTNLIEALWLCSGCKSFRGTRDRDFIGFSENLAEVKTEFVDSMRTQKIEFAVARENIREKKVTLNGVKLLLLSKLFGTLKCVIFTPEDLELSKGSPDNRRTFIDLCISQIKPNYIHAINKYDNILSQRNAMLKDIAFKGQGRENLEIWDRQLSEVGAYISLLRYTYTKKLNSFASRLYYKLSRGNESLELSYYSTVYSSMEGRSDFKGEMAEEYFKKLKNNENEDIRCGYTMCGVHRDDIITKINNLNSRDFGSQGQQRSVALVMKLSQAEILFDETGEAPVILLDDVLSELDYGRQDFVINEINDMQIFITCCDPTVVLKHKMGKIFFMKNGKIYREQD